MPKLTCNCGCVISITDKARQSLTELTCPKCGETRKLKPMSQPEASARSSFVSVVGGSLVLLAAALFLSNLQDGSAAYAPAKTIAQLLVITPVPLLFAYRIWLGIDGRYSMKFRHPANGFIVDIKDSFPSSLIFGPFYAIYHEAWPLVVIGILLVFAGCGVPWVILPWFAPHLLRRWYLTHGYTQISGREL